MKKVLIAAVLVVVAAVVVIGMVMGVFTRKEPVETNKLTLSFASASAEVKGELQKAVTAIKAKDLDAALVSLKKVVDSGNLTADQKQALSDTVTDITTILSQNPPANSDELFDRVAEITDALNS
jgi:hypothetical protein